MKVVLDTNVLITAFRDEYSYQKRIIDEVSAGHIQAFANAQTLRENRFILEKLIEDSSYKKELDNFFSQVSVVENKRQVRVVSDPEDNKILESAVEAGADFLITEDRALLELNNYRKVRVVQPVEFWHEYQDQTGDDPWSKWIKFVSGK